MATIKGTYDDGITVKTAVIKTGGLQLSWWNSSSTNRTGYMNNAQVADLVAAINDVPANLLSLSWPDPLNPTSSTNVNVDERYDIDNERYFILRTTTRTLGPGFTYPYTLQVNILFYYQNQLAYSCNASCSFTTADWATVLGNSGDGVLQSFALRVANPTFSIFNYPVNSPSEQYTDYSQYDKGYCVASIQTGTYTDGTSSAFAYQSGGQGHTGTELTYVFSNNNWWLHFIWDIKEPKIPTSEPDESFGGYDNSSDVGAVPGVPGVDMVLTGLVRLYQPTAGQMVNFSEFLWAIDWTDFQKIINSLKQWFSSPLETIVSVNMLPIDYFYDYSAGTAITPSNAAIIMGGYDTGCVAPPCGGNFKQVDCGTISLAPYFKSFLDCNPYTKYTIYLPYVGFRELDSNALFAPDGANLRVVYNVDMITGCFTCFLHITKENADTELSHVLYSYSGNMATQVPLSAANMNDFIRTLGQAASGVALAAATGGASTSIAGVGARTLMGGASSSDYNISHGGNLSMESGYLGIQYPYLIVERPRESFPDGYLHTLGKPSDIGGTLGDFSGFVVVKDCHLDGVPATDEEKNEIMNLLKQGVIV